MSGDFLGTGWAFPVCPGFGGGLEYSSGAANIQQSLLHLLRTVQGERVMRPTFGTKARDLVFAPGSVQNLRLLETTLREAIRDFEPRVQVDRINAELDPRDDTMAVVEVDYRIRPANTRDNLVFPFYLGPLQDTP
ncbi:GPW/gp25 family protein [Nonomuraea sp. NPDC050153]|uniref:GPW/gp25 family protein n=1 Tax=Nonomuraea sp. NPDC050153 TaxID=3364359 RepID=UPI00378B77BE